LQYPLSHPYRVGVKTANPLLISTTEAGYQLSLPEQDVAELVRAGELLMVRVRGQELIIYESLTAFIRRMRRKAVSV
jgi:hypothetical protein